MRRSAWFFLVGLALLLSAFTYAPYQLCTTGSYCASELHVKTPLCTGVPPTISSGFGTSPSVVANNGNCAFSINVGTGGTANSGVIAFPTAPNGWVLDCTDTTTQNATVYLTKQTASTTTTATVGNFDAAGAAGAWAASDVLQCNASMY